MYNKNIYWWNQDSDAVSDSLHQAVSTLLSDQEERQTERLRWLRLYSNRAISGLNANSYNQLQDNSPKLTLNVVQAVIETAVSYIGTQKTRVKFTTCGGGSKFKEKAALLTPFVDGIFQHTNFYDISRQIFRDSCVFGIGFLKVDSAGNDIVLKRILPSDVFWDEAEALSGEPRTIYHVFEEQPDLVLDRFPEAEDLMDGAGNIKEDSPWGRTGLCNPISVIEAWHLSPNKDLPGRHVVCLTNGVLLDEEWDADHFPLIPFRWLKRPLGYDGQGIAEMLQSSQFEINKTLRKLQAHLDLASSKVFVQKGSSITKESFTNEVFGIIEYSGNQQPVFAPIQAISPEYQNWVNTQYAKAFEIVGISQLASTSQKPAGLNSGVALREYNDLQTKRFLAVAQDWEKFVIDVAKALIIKAKMLSADTQDQEEEFFVQIPYNGQLVKIRWSDIDLDEDKFQLTPWPTSLLPQSPAGQLQALTELGQIIPGVQLQLLDNIEYPDVKTVIMNTISSERLVSSTIDAILEGLDYSPPQPWLDLPKAINQVRSALCEAQLNNIPKERIMNLSDWLEAAIDLIKPPAPPVDLNALPQPPTNQNLMTTPISIPRQPMGLPPPGSGPVR